MAETRNIRTLSAPELLHVYRTLCKDHHILTVEDVAYKSRQALVGIIGEARQTIAHVEYQTYSRALECLMHPELPNPGPPARELLNCMKTNSSLMEEVFEERDALPPTEILCEVCDTTVSAWNLVPHLDTHGPRLPPTWDDRAGYCHFCDVFFDDHKNHVTSLMHSYSIITRCLSEPKKYWYCPLCHCTHKPQRLCGLCNAHAHGGPTDQSWEDLWRDILGPRGYKRQMAQAALAIKHSPQEERKRRYARFLCNYLPCRFPGPRERRDQTWALMKPHVNKSA